MTWVARCRGPSSPGSSHLSGIAQEEWGASQECILGVEHHPGGNKSLGQGALMETGFVITTSWASSLMHTSCLGSSAPVHRSAPGQHPPALSPCLAGTSGRTVLLLSQEPTGRQTMEEAPERPPCPFPALPPILALRRLCRHRRKQTHHPTTQQEFDPPRAAAWARSALRLTRLTGRKTGAASRAEPLALGGVSLSRTFQPVCPQSCIWCKDRQTERRRRRRREKPHSFGGSQETKQTEQDIPINALRATRGGRIARGPGAAGRAWAPPGREPGVPGLAGPGRCAARGPDRQAAGCTGRRGGGRRRGGGPGQAAG